MENLKLPSTYQNNNDTVLRAALYIRVSTAEQAMHGYSIEAQKEYLEAYAKENKMRVVGIYADEGKSASKRLYQRKELLRMIEEMEAGEIDVILFKDITRWSRNSSHYHRIQDRIDAAGGYWIAVQQPYLETKTPTGRFQVTVMLGNAQLEAEQTSERIKFVNASRIPKGGVPYGKHSCPNGYTVGTINGMKCMVKDESKAAFVIGVFEFFRVNQTIKGTLVYIYDTFNRRMGEKSLRAMLKNPIYKGEYQGVQNYCEPYFTPEYWDEIQAIFKKRSYTPSKPTRTYIFSSMVKCSVCGRPMVANLNTKTTHIYYRCSSYIHHKACTNNKGVREDRIEQWLLENIEDEMNKYTAIVEIESVPKPDVAKKRKALERKFANVKELYIEGDLTKEEYTEKKAAIEEQLAALPEQVTKDTSKIKEFLNSDWHMLYDNLLPIEKRSFWRSVVDYIIATPDKKLTPIFFE